MTTTDVGEAMASTQIPRFLVVVGIVARAFVFVSALAAVVFCLLALDRGFEITDEAYYLLLGMHPKAVSLYVSAQHWIMGPLWQMTGSLVSFRAMGLFILVGSSVVLAAGTCVALAERGVRVSSSGKALVVCGSVVGALLYIATINLSPSYNLLTSAGAYLAAGCTLLTLHQQRGWLRGGLAILNGAALCVVFVNKPSAGVATFALLSLWMVLLARTPREGALWVFASGTVFAATVAALALAQTTPSEIQSGLANGLELFRMVQTESVGARLLRYASDYAGYVGQTLRSFWAVALCIGVFLLTRRAVIIAATLVILAFTLLDGNYLLGGVEQYVVQIRAALAVLLASLAVSASVWARDRRLATLVLGLAALPYAVAFGTGNSLFTQIIVSMAPWGTLIAASAMLADAERSDRSMAFALLAAFSVTLASQIVTSGFRAPYHLAAPLSGQTERVNVGNLGRVRVDAGTAAFVRSLDAAVTTCRISPSAAFLGLYNIPGVALALRAVPVVTPWLNNVAQAETALAFGPPGVLQSVVVAIRENSDGSRVVLPSRLAAFPTGFRFCGDATYPFENQRITIWHATPG